MEIELLALQRLQTCGLSAGSSLKLYALDALTVNLQSVYIRKNIYMLPGEYIFKNKNFLFIQFLFKNRNVRHHYPQFFIRTVCWSWPSEYGAEALQSPGSSGHHSPQKAEWKLLLGFIPVVIFLKSE